MTMEGRSGPRRGEQTLFSSGKSSTRDHSAMNNINEEYACMLDA